MTEEAQRIAIAEACGFASILQSPKGVWSARNHEDLKLALIPDYLHDRNATWQAAEQLGEATIKAMRYWLFEICGEMKAHHATAAQESEAIVRATGKWVD